MIDLFGDVCRPRAFVEPRKLIERQPHLAVIGIKRLHRAGPREHHQRRVGSVRAGLCDIVRKLLAEHLDGIGVEEQVAKLILTVPGDAEDARERSCFTAHLRFELGEHHALPAAHCKVRSDFASSQEQTLHNARPLLPK
jgi:hypothetical protein